MESIKHQHKNTKAVLNRMSRAIGHFQSVKKMVEDARDCSDILIQLSAVKAEVENISKVILKEHIEHCIVNAVRENDEETIIKLENAIDKLL